jgi:hypothetical protein
MSSISKSIIYFHSILRSAQEQNVLILHDSPQAHIRKQFINEGVVRADPESYLQRYGAELSPFQSSRHGYLVEEATRIIPPPLISSSDHDYHRTSSPYISDTWETRRVRSPIPRSSTYHYDYSRSDSPYHYCNQSSRRYGYDPEFSYNDYYNQSRRRYEYDSDFPRRYGYDSGFSYNDYCNQSSRRYGYDSYSFYDDYPTYHGDYSTMIDVTPSWDRYCRSKSYDPYYSQSYSYREPYYRSFSSYPPTIRVRSEGEFRDVLCDLTNGRVPHELNRY